MLPLVGQKLALQDKNLGTSLMSACIVAAQIVMVPMAMLVGAKADAWGRKPLFLIALSVLTIRGCLYPFSDNPYWLVGVQLLDGVGAGIYGAIFPVIVADLMRGTGRFNVAQGAIITAQGIGAALSTTLAGVVVVHAGYSAAFLTLAGVGCCWACALFLCHARDPRTGIRTGSINPRPPPSRQQPSLLFPVDGALATWGIAGLATAGVIARPFRWPEAIWAVAGALALVAFGLLPWTDAVTGVRKGLDVYLFLAGMMLIAEAARQEGVFDWAAALAVEHARGSPQRLFALVYAVGTVVTVFLSNDATAVVLTPAVYAATRAAGATPLPYLFVCAFIANAASFVLPISNPANLVIFGDHMPHLAAWLRQFGVPSIVSIAATYLALRMIQRGPLAREKIVQAFSRSRLAHGGRLTLWGIGAVAVALLCCSALDVQLGLPTFVCGVVTTAIVLVLNRQSPLPIIKGVSWGVLPLVAGLFVLVEALHHTGVIAALSDRLHAAVANSTAGATYSVGLIVASRLI